MTFARETVVFIKNLFCDNKYVFVSALVDLDQGEVDVPMMPSEEEIQRMREECAALGAEAYHADAHLIDEVEDSAEAIEDSETTGAAGKQYNNNVFVW